MNNTFIKECNYIVSKSIEEVLPDKAVKRALGDFTYPEGRLILVAIGKAAYRMASCALQVIGDRIDEGIVITKHGYADSIPDSFVRKIKVYEAGHPVPDNDTYTSTRAVLDMTETLTENDMVLFLVSGGGSALFECPLIDTERYEVLTEELLKCGADIKEINTVRKRLSSVKGGKFAKHCMPAKIYSIVLSDVLGDPLDVIASGPAYPDSSTMEDADAIIKKYGICLSDDEDKIFHNEPVKELDNVTTMITGSVSELCKAASEAAGELGYNSVILSDTVDGEASEVGRMLGNIAKYASNNVTENTAYIIGGETVVHVSGNGLGGRNQELALASAEVIKEIDNVAVFSCGSDGTDGPTDAAGGYVDGETIRGLEKNNIDINEALNNHDSYNALKAVDGLIVTGPTGTNVNDFSVALVKVHKH